MDRPILDNQRAVADFGEVLIVGHDDEGDAVLAGQIEQDLHDFRAVDGIQISRRLVGEEDFRLVDDGAGDGDPLLFAARKLGGQVVHAITQADALQSLEREFRAVPA